MSRRTNGPADSIGFAALRDELPARLAGPTEEVARWLLAAAKYGLVEAQTALGQVLLDGKGVAQDRAAAATWFGIAADAGYAPALNMLGRCRELGWGVVVDLPGAADCYRRAAETGLDWAQYNYANMLLRGRGVLRDRPRALMLYRLAAEQGHAKSINMVGRFIEEGWEMPADPAGAADWYRRAAEAGDFRAQYNLASILALAGDITQAETWLRQAMDSATPEFLHVMSRRLAGCAESRLRRASGTAARLATERA